MPKKMIFLFIVGFEPGLSLVGWNLFSEKTPMADHFQSREYMDRFVRHHCKLNAETFFDGKVSKTESQQCNNLFYERTEDLLISGYEMSATDIEKVWKDCQGNCHTLRDIEKVIRKNRQALRNDDR